MSLILSFLVILMCGFTFSQDAPKSPVWRQIYKECLLTCSQEINNRHWCNMHCVRIADEVFYEMERKKEELR